MIELQHRHLITLTLTVDFAAMVNIGETPAGLRRIAPMTGGTGERTPAGPTYTIFDIG